VSFIHGLSKQTAVFLQERIHAMNMLPISPETCRYIKLGAGGNWARWAFEQNQIPFGYRTIPHELCVTGKWDAVTKFLIEAGERKPSKAKDGTREIRDFYTLGEECLWITIADGHLWWIFSSPGVTWLGDDKTAPNRVRQAKNGWCNSNINGVPLRIDTLSSRLTQVAAYRGTLCNISAKEYLVRRINAVEEPVVIQARLAKEKMLKAATEMIQDLHWADFEVMVELIFARTGWQRISRLGGTMKDVDLSLRHPTIGETAFVQVKSRADQTILDDYIQRFVSSEIYDRLFFVCHSIKGHLKHTNFSNINIWTGVQLADAALNAGLYDWLIEKSL